LRFSLPCVFSRISNWSGIGFTVASDAAFKGKAFHKKPVLFRSYVTYFVRGSRPLKLTVGQAFIAKAESVSFKYQALDPVFSGTAEEEEGSFFEGIHTIVEPDDCHQTINATSKVGPATRHYDFPDPYGFFKHG